jgi:selenium-dependent xanthine dehydrogenase
MTNDIREIRVQVNGSWHTLRVGPRTTLLEMLREQLRLTGTKNGCGTGHCGACTVIVDDQAERACVYRAWRADGRSVQTIEGLAVEDQLHPLQRAFVEHGAVQCGFCTPGFIMAAKALLDRTPHPADDQIKQALSHNLCRCTGYVKIVQAIRAAAVGSAVAEAPASPDGSIIGQPVLRPDALDKTTGRTRFTDDLCPEGLLHAAVLRSAHPHARLRGLDVNVARQMAGVAAVLTAGDVPGDRNHGVLKKDWPVLVYDKARYVGDVLALVAAETQSQARDAVQAIRVDYEPLPVLSSAEQALAADAPLVHDDGNLLKVTEITRGDVETAFAHCDLVLEHTYHTPVGEHAFMEPEAALAVPEADGGVTVYVGSQDPFADRAQIAASLALPEEQVRVVHMPTGGAFGGREDIVAQIHAALLARVTGRPVKLTLSRAESMRVHPKRHATQITIKTGATRDGRILAQRVHMVGDTGAYASMGPAVMPRAAAVATGPYEIPNVHIESLAVYTNNPPAGSFRGFGAPQAHFAAESQMDLVAEQLGMSPFEIRRRHALRVGSTTNTGQILRDSVGIVDCIDRVEAAVNEIRAYEDRLVLSPHLRRGWGVACGYKNIGRGSGIPDTASASVEATRDGRLVVRTGAAEVGQGLEVVLAQIAAQELGVAPHMIELVLGDTAQSMDCGPTNASRQTYTTGNAVRGAAARLRQILGTVAAAALDTTPDGITFAGGLAHAGSGGPVIALADLVTLAHGQGQPTRTDFVYTPPATVPLGQAGDTHFAHGFACQAVQVEVDTRNGDVRVLRVVAASDVGRAINPSAVEGQIEGAVLMGIGTALSETFVVEDGIVRTDTLGKLNLPGVEAMPDIRCIIVEAPADNGPYGAKGAGEVAGIPTAPAITNAIRAAVGLHVTRLPVDRQLLLAALGHGHQV